MSLASAPTATAFRFEMHPVFDLPYEVKDAIKQKVSNPGYSGFRDLLENIRVQAATLRYSMGTICVIYMEEEMVGWACLLRNVRTGNPACHDVMAFVKESHRRKGIATRAVETVLLECGIPKNETVGVFSSTMENLMKKIGQSFIFSMY